MAPAGIHATPGSSRSGSARPAAAEGARYRLAEAMAERVAALCLAHEGVRRVDVLMEKPGSLRFARSAVVEITRDAPAARPVGSEAEP